MEHEVEFLNVVLPVPDTIVLNLDDGENRIDVVKSREVLGEILSRPVSLYADADCLHVPVGILFERANVVANRRAEGGEADCSASG